MPRRHNRRSRLRGLPQAPPALRQKTVSPTCRVMAQKLRVPLGFVIAAAVLYFAEPSTMSILVGLPVALIGALFRALAAGVIKKDSSLATAGMYALTRNPLYFGSSLLATG